MQFTDEICQTRRTTFGADAAGVQPGSTVAIVGDDAVGLCAVIAAKQMAGMMRAGIR